MTRQNGFTIIELMVAAVILAILVAVGVPAMGDFVRDTRINSAVNDFIAATTVARSEAIKRRSPVTVCASANALAATPTCDTGAAAAWENGWVVFADADGDATRDAAEEILQRREALGDDLSIRTDPVFAEYVSFSSVGQTRSVANASVFGNLVFCDERGIVDQGASSTARGLNVSRTGRPQSLREQDEIVALGISCP